MFLLLCSSLVYSIYNGYKIYYIKPYFVWTQPVLSHFSLLGCQKLILCVCHSLTPQSRSLQDNNAPEELQGLISPFSAVIAIIVANMATQYETTHIHTRTYTYTQLEDGCFLHFPDLIFCFNENQLDTTAQSSRISGLSALSYNPLLFAFFLKHTVCLSRSVQLMIHDCWSMATPVSFLTTVNLWLFCWHLTGGGPGEEEFGHGRTRRMLAASHVKSQELSWQSAPHKIKCLTSNSHWIPNK